MESIHATLIRTQLHWAGHVKRMDDSRIPKRLLYGELSSGKRSLGHPKLRFKDTMRASLKHCEISKETWEESAENRPLWRSLEAAGVLQYEENRNTTAEQKRLRRKNSEKSSDTGSAPHIPFPKALPFKDWLNKPPSHPSQPHLSDEEMVIFAREGRTSKVVLHEVVTRESECLFLNGHLGCGLQVIEMTLGRGCRSKRKHWATWL